MTTAFHLEHTEDGYLDIHFNLPVKPNTVLRDPTVVRISDDQAQRLVDEILRYLRRQSSAAPH